MIITYCCIGILSVLAGLILGDLTSFVFPKEHREFISEIFSVAYGIIIFLTFYIKL